MKREFTTADKPQRREDLGAEEPCRTSALFAEQYLGMAHFEQDYWQSSFTAETRRAQRRCSGWKSLLSSRLCGLSGVGFLLQLGRAVSLRFHRTRYALPNSSAHHKPSKPLSENNGVEIDKQPQLPSPQSELTQQTGFMHWLNLGQGTWIHHNATTDQQFDLIRFSQRSALVAQCQGVFTLERQVAQVQFMAQARLVGGWQQARPQFTVHLDGAGDDLMGQSLSFPIPTICRGVKRGRSAPIPCRRARRLIRQHNARSLFFQPKHESLYALLQNGHIEVEQQCQLPSTQLEIGECLRSMHRENRFDRFYLDDHCVAYQHIETKAALKLHALVNHGHRLLHPIGKAAPSKLLRQCALVGRFRFRRSEFAVDLDGRADDFMSKLVRSHWRRVIVAKPCVNSAEGGADGAAFSCANGTIETKSAAEPATKATPNFNAETRRAQRNAEKNNPLRISANLCEPLRLCVESSQPAIKSGHSSAKSAEKRLRPEISALFASLRFIRYWVLAAASPRRVPAVLCAQHLLPSSRRCNPRAAIQYELDP